jgi:hypothetical protein
MALPFLKVQVVSALITTLGLNTVFEMMGKRFEEGKSNMAVV